MTMTSSKRCRNSLALLILLALALARPPTALAQPRAPSPQDLETARTLYKEGKELRAHGDLPGALEKLQAAHALGNTPVTGIELARTYAMVGQLVEARETCLSIARMSVAPDETEKSADARVAAAKLAEALRPRIPTLIVRVAGLAPGQGAHVSIDGEDVPDAAVGEPLKVDPGKHEVAVHTGEGDAARDGGATVELEEGKTGEVTITLPPPLAPPAAPPPVSQPTRERQTPLQQPEGTGPSGLTTFGIGAAVAGVA
jgi:hypothetical protein